MNGTKEYGADRCTQSIRGGKSRLYRRRDPSPFHALAQHPRAAHAAEQAGAADLEKAREYSVVMQNVPGRKPAPRDTNCRLDICGQTDIIGDRHSF